MFYYFPKVQDQPLRNQGSILNLLKNCISLFLNEFN